MDPAELPGRRGCRAAQSCDGRDRTNAEIPKPWPVGLNGQEQPPWALYFCVYFCDPNTGSLYTWANRTWGSQLCYRALEEKTMVMRALRGYMPRLMQVPTPTSSTWVPGRMRIFSIASMRPGWSVGP